jgi:hypothetical protein
VHGIVPRPKSIYYRWKASTQKVRVIGKEIRFIQVPPMIGRRKVSSPSAPIPRKKKNMLKN